jgi:glycosyltransferase involved in cell wall biosynthesis
MRIAQFVEGDAPGGTERLVIEISVDLRRRGHEVLVIGPQRGPGNGWLAAELRALGFEWVEYPRRSMLDLRQVTDITRVISDHGIDVVHSHEFAPSVIGAVAARVTGRKHVMTMHSGLYFASALRRRVAFRWAARHSSVVAVSGDTRDDAERLLGLRPGVIHVIPPGVATRSGDRAKVRVELGVLDDELLVVAIGNVSARKAHEIILRALIDLRARRPDVPWRFAIAGSDQGCAASLEAIAAEHGVADRFHLLGHRSDAADILAAADVFAMSSLHEGMPLAIMEAMFAGKPVVTSVAGGIAEMITNGSDGLLTPVGDVAGMSAALERVLTAAALRDALGAAARERAARQFGIATMMDSYLKLYEQAPTRQRIA